MAKADREMEMTRRRTECVLCGAKEIGPLYNIGKASVWLCRNCRLVFHELSLDIDFDPSSHYSSDYYGERQEYYSDDSPDSKAHQETMDSFRTALDMLEKHRPSRGKVLDVGCGYGTFLKIATERGWDAVGVDISEHAASVARERAGVEVFAGQLKDIGFSDSEFDAISLNDAFEHFLEPNEQLALIAKLLKPDGILFLNTPNQQALMRSLAHMIYKLSLGKFNYPVRKLYHEFHLYYYSEDNLRQILYENDFELIEVKKKTIPFLKARGTHLERLIVRGLSYLEKFTGREFEILAIAGKIQTK